MEKFKIATVKHPNCDRPFTFRVPENLDLDVGDYVLCKTKKGPSEVAKCITPSFEIMECHLLEFYNVEPKKLQPIVGILKPVMYGYTPAEE